MPSLTNWGRSTQDSTTRAGDKPAGRFSLSGVLPFGSHGGRRLTRVLKGDRSLEAAIRIPNGGAVQAPGTGPLLRQVRDKVRRRDWAAATEAIAAVERGPRSIGLGPRRAEALVAACLEAAALEDLTKAQVEAPDNHILAALVALALLDVEAADGLELAGRVLDPHDPIALMSPLLAEAHFRYVLRAAEDPDEVIAAFEDWSDLDPTDLRPYRLAARRIYARWGVAALLSEADRASDRVRDELGQGAYAAMALEAIRSDATRAQDVDARRLLDGLGTLFRRGAEQRFVNEAAARIAAVVFDPAPLFGRGDAPLQAMKATLKDGLRELLRRHLRSIEPSVWDHGRTEALEVLADLFRDELDGGATLRFTACGLLVDAPARARA